MTEDLADGKARQHHVTEMPAAAVVPGHVDRHARHRHIAGKEPRELGELIFAATACKPRVGIVVGDLLQTEDVEVGNRLRMPHDAGRIDFAVDAAAPLDVPGDELHLIPARMNDCTNCLWKSRNAISSGALVSKVAAVMIDQSIP